MELVDRIERDLRNYPLEMIFSNLALKENQYQSFMYVNQLSSFSFLQLLNFCLY